MKTSIKILLIAIILQSCDIKKEAYKTKNDIDLDESFRSISFRKGDSIVYVPSIKLKDTTIYRTTVQGTVLKTVYDENGQISTIECQSSQIAELKEMNRRLLDQSKTKESSKEEKIDNTFIYVIAGAIVLMFLIVIIALFIYLKSQTNKFNLLLSNLSK